MQGMVGHAALQGRRTASPENLQLQYLTWLLVAPDMIKGVLARALCQWLDASIQSLELY